MIVPVAPSEEWIIRFGRQLRNKWAHDYSEIAIREMIEEIRIPSLLYLRFRTSPEDAADDEAMYVE